MFTRITPSKNGRESLQYARGSENGKGHNNKEHRNLLVGGVNLLPDSEMSYEDQMGIFWKKAKPNHKIQVRRIIGSFSKKELDPEDPNAKYKAMEMATEFSEKFYPDRQAAIFIQDDGEGGCIHFHLIVNDCAMTDNKGCSADQQKFWYVEKNFDELAKSYIELDAGELAKDKTTQTERRKRKENQKAIEAGEPEKVEYLWRDDMKSRIRESMKEATNREDFLMRLTAHGVEGEFRSSKKRGAYIIYELVDLSGFNGEPPKKNGYFKSKSFKMGDDFEIEELDRQIQNNLGKNTVQDSHIEDVEPVMKQHKAKKEDPKQKTEEERKTEKDEQLKAQFNALAGIDFFKDHTTWETKDNYEELKQESARRWKQFKEWYPDDYEQRLMIGDISKPKQKEQNDTQTVIEPEKKKTPVGERPQTVMKPTPTVLQRKTDDGRKKEQIQEQLNRLKERIQAETEDIRRKRRKTDDGRKKEQIQEQLNRLKERIQTEAEKQAMQDLNDWYNEKY